MGNKTLLKTQFDFLPISKYLVSKIPLVGHQICYKISFRTSKKALNVPTPFLGVLSNSNWEFWLSNPHGILPFWVGGGGGGVMGALVLAILKRAEICW